MKHCAMLIGIVLTAAIRTFSAPPPPSYGRVPAIVTVNAIDARASEATNETGRFLLRRSLNTRSPLVVYYRLSGTASNGVDYEHLLNSVQFEAAQSSVAVVVKPIDDLAVERAETVILRLAAPPSLGSLRPYRIGAANTATITIIDNDIVPPQEIVLAPSALGTIVRWPLLGQPDSVRENSLQSTYFATTLDNTEFRRAFLEFQIPYVPRGILSATFLLTDGSGDTTTEFPPDAHELSAYPADLAITTSDYDQVTLPLTTFETDVNVHEEMFALDVTEAVRTFEGKNLGFRIKLAADPRAPGGGGGADFQANAQAFPPRLIIKTPSN